MRSPSRSRSRSPRTHDQDGRRRRSPQHHRRRPKAATSGVPVSLPYDSRNLTKRDFVVFKPMFALYLDIQKGKFLEDVDENEVKGRWKSFVHKWNMGELAEGWYDPSTLQKALSSGTNSGSTSRAERYNKQNPNSGQSGRHALDISGVTLSKPDVKDSNDESDGSVGPALPRLESSSERMGPSIPNMQDLQLRREMHIAKDFDRREDMRIARRDDRKRQKEAIDELVPRAEPGTRERQLEKKRDINDKMKAFRERSPGAAEVNDTELMGGGDEVTDFRRQKQEFERKKNDRELRKEEILRARAVEREERLSEYRHKEDKTMAMLKALAKQNFG